MQTRSRYSNFGDVDEYLMSLNDNDKASLEKLRQLIREMAPQATEMMKYNMAYYEYKGMLCAFAAQKDCLCFYILDDSQLEKYQPELRGLSVSKGAIRFRSFNDLPESVTRRIIAEAVAVNESRYKPN